MKPHTAVPEWPKVGERYVWEMLKPHAAAGLIVTNVVWNDEEWMVECEALTVLNNPNGKKYWNTLERFHEACSAHRNIVEALESTIGELTRLLDVTGEADHASIQAQIDQLKALSGH